MTDSSSGFALPSPLPEFTPERPVDFNVYDTAFDWVDERRPESSINATHYLEFQAGTEDGVGDYWQDGNLYISPEAFRYAEFIWNRHLPFFQGYGYFEMPRAAGLRIVQEWQAVAEELARTEDVFEVAKLLEIDHLKYPLNASKAVYYRLEIAKMLKDLATEISVIYDWDEHIWVIGL